MLRRRLDRETGHATYVLSSAELPDLGVFSRRPRASTSNTLPTLHTSSFFTTQLSILISHLTLTYPTHP